MKSKEKGQKSHRATKAIGNHQETQPFPCLLAHVETARQLLSAISRLRELQNDFRFSLCKAFSNLNAERRRQRKQGAPSLRQISKTLGVSVRKMEYYARSQKHYVDRLGKGDDGILEKMRSLGMTKSALAVPRITGDNVDSQIERLRHVSTRKMKCPSTKRRTRDVR
jgi:hypothetical protein